ncbi:hypothetical protein LTR85_001240 [Meristemomyces frigidus]|nr:hypothetical protein LTR85_001240 [Meristemomyces frigidus]
MTIEAKVINFDFSTLPPLIRRLALHLPQINTPRAPNISIDWVTRGAEYSPALVDWCEAVTKNRMRLKDKQEKPQYSMMRGDGVWLSTDARMGGGVDATRHERVTRRIFRAIRAASIVPAPSGGLKRRREEAWMGWIVELDERKGKRRRLDGVGRYEFIPGFDTRFSES